jgi:hypothetical protein
MSRCTSSIAGFLILIAVLKGAAAQGPVPFVNQPLLPTSISPGHGAFTLTVNGTGFLPGATVRWDGHPRPTTFVSTERLQAAITAADVARPRTAAITVTNPPAGAASNLVYFMVGRQSSTVAFAEMSVPLNLPPGSTASAFAAGDFNGDGILDVAFATGNATIEVMLGNGDGTFQPPIATVFNIDLNNSQQSCYGIGALLAGDFNGDGKLDLAMAYECFEEVTGWGVLYTALGAGDGTFTLVGDETALGTPTAAGDFNQDGALDVATMIPKYENLTFYPGIAEGSAAGVFTTGVSRVGGLQTSAWSIPAVGDFNHDGKLDLAIPDDSLGSQVYVVLGQGNGSFLLPDTFDLYGIYHGSNAGSAAAADLNGDGNLDLVAGGFSVLLGNGNGTFRPGGGVPLEGLNAAFDQQLADFNNDNKLDAVLVGSDGSLDLLLGNGDGTFEKPQIWAGKATSWQPLMVGDFNGDGKLDVMVPDYDPATGEMSLSLFMQTTLGISPGILNFGMTHLGTSRTLSARLKNFGDSNVSIDSIELAKQPVPNYAETNNCGPSLAPGASCTITVTYTPHRQDYPGSVRISYAGALGSPQSLVLRGSHN